MKIKQWFAFVNSVELMSELVRIKCLYVAKSFLKSNYLCYLFPYHRCTSIRELTSLKQLSNLH